jgi:hypothetical protein
MIGGTINQRYAHAAARHFAIVMPALAAARLYSPPATGPGKQTSVSNL